jgi:hypothetical protein
LLVVNHSAWYAHREVNVHASTGKAVSLNIRLIG